jgi:23S rRNA pseudouridine1911/1915/1917 synthase
VPTWTVSDTEAGTRLDRFLAAPDRIGSRGRVVEAIDRGRVFLNGREATVRDGGTALCAGDTVRHWEDRPGSASRRSGTRTGDVRIVYEDAALLVADKPAGLLTVPLGRRRDATSVFEQLAAHFDPTGRRTPFVVHRIDRDTSGLVVFAKTPQAQLALKDQFERREPERVYLAIVSGVPSPARGTWRDRLVWDDEAVKQTVAVRAREAISHYRVVEALKGTALIEVRLETGKRNQIRVQASLHGHPLVGEKQYAGEEGAGARGQRGIEFPRQALHAHRLGFRHPVDGRALSFEAPPPADFMALLKRVSRPPAARPRLGRLR